MSCPLNRFPDRIQTFKPTIRSGLIANLTPKPFLEVQTRLIAWQILQAKSDMCLDKNVHLFSSMPPGPINIQPNRIPSEPPIEMSQTTHKSLSVSLWPSDQTLSTQQRSHPPEHIQPLTVLACRRNPKPLSSLSPSHSQTRMQRETRLVLKNDRLSGVQRPKFFLTPCEIAWPLRSVPEDKYNRPVSADIPIGASSSEPGEPSILSQNGASSEPPRWDHPSEPDLTQILTETSLSAPPIPDEPSGLNEQDAQASLPVPKTSTPDRLPCASRDSSSDASNPRPRRSIPDADPPISAIKPLSLFQYGLPGFAEPWPINALGLLRDGLTLKLDFS